MQAVGILAFFGSLEPVGVWSVTEYDAQVQIEIACGYGIDECLQVGARSGDQDRGSAGHQTYCTSCLPGTMRAQLPRLFAMGVEQFDRPDSMARIDDDDHADTAVERAPHLVRFNVAVLLQEVENCALLPGRVYRSRRSDRYVQNARNVLGDAAAGDMRQPLHRDLFEQ